MYIIWIGLFVLIFICAVIADKIRNARVRTKLGFLKEAIFEHCPECIARLRMEQRYSIYNYLSIFYELTMNDADKCAAAGRLLQAWKMVLDITHQSAFSYFNMVQDSGVVRELAGIKDDFLKDTVLESANIMKKFANGYIGNISSERFANEFYKRSSRIIKAGG